MQQNPPEPLNVVADDEMCFGVGRTVEDAFNAGLRGNSPIQDLPNIGPHIRQQLNNANIQTVNDFLQAALVAGTTAARMARFVASLVPNARQNQCTPSQFTRPRVYHVSFVNVCGYNTLIRLVQFAHNHQNDFAMFGLANAFNFNFAPQQLALRHRGTNNGSRHCACRNTQDACTGANNINEHQGHCRWVANRQRCVPRGGGGETAGYLGRYLGPNTFQRDKQKDRTVTGPRRTGGWRHPDGAAQLQQQAPPPQPPGNGQLPAAQLPQQQNVLGGGNTDSTRRSSRRIQAKRHTLNAESKAKSNTQQRTVERTSKTCFAKSPKLGRIKTSGSKRATTPHSRQHPALKQVSKRKSKPKSKPKSSSKAKPQPTVLKSKSKNKSKTKKECKKNMKTFR